MRLKLALAYDGSAYCGWQLQLGGNSQPTIQGAVEAALFTLLRQSVRVHGAGRTDSGVHALGQVAHCDVPERDWDWRKRLNCVLPADIRVVKAESAEPGFHSRNDAIAKTYIYRLWQERSFMAPELRNFSWQCGPLDMNAIIPGLDLFKGVHDFASFQNAGTRVKSTVREITQITLAKCQASQWLPPHLPLLELGITGSGFLKQMVRNIAGFVVAIGKRKLAWSDLAAVLEKRSRAALPVATAPARGLFLARVDYGGQGGV